MSGIYSKRKILVDVNTHSTLYDVKHQMGRIATKISDPTLKSDLMELYCMMGQVMGKMQVTRHNYKPKRFTARIVEL